MSPARGGEVDFSGDVEVQARAFWQSPAWPGQDDRALQPTFASTTEVRWYNEAGNQRAAFIPYLYRKTPAEQKLMLYALPFVLPVVGLSGTKLYPTGRLRGWRQLAEEVDRELGDIFSIHEQIASSVVSHLQIKLIKNGNKITGSMIYSPVERIRNTRISSRLPI